MKLLVVGGAGYIGSVCTELLLNQGHEVTVFDNLSEGHRAAIDSRASFVEGDLAERQSITAALSRTRPEAVMHFAANALVGESMQNPSKYFRNNVANGLNLLDGMVEARVSRLVFSSTCAIFGPPERVPIDETLAKNSDQPIRRIQALSLKRSCAGTRQIHGLNICLTALFQRRRRVGELWEDHRLETHFIPERA